MPGGCGLLLKSCDCHMINLYYGILQLYNAKDLLDKLESSTAEQVGKSCLETCLDTIVIALSLVCKITIPTKFSIGSFINFILSHYGRVCQRKP